MRRWLCVALLVGCGSSSADGSNPEVRDATPETTTEASAPSDTQGTENGFSYAFSPDPVAFDCSEGAGAWLAKNVTHVTVGGSTMFVGYEQVGGTDQDPIVARADGDAIVFCEHSKKGGGVDGRAYGVTWDGGDRLYVVYTIVGGGTLFDTVCAGGWLSSYGNGGASAKATVIGRVDAKTGVVMNGTFVESKLTKSGQLKTNTLLPADAIHVLANGNLQFIGKPSYCTLNPDQSLMCDPSVSADYPADYRAQFTPDLTTMLCASASGVSVVKQPCP